MEKIASFTVDHRYIKEGVYISRLDGDITTYDLRMRKPNTGELIDNATMHSLEHMFATVIRNSDIRDTVIYFGPMGCQTGFYLLVRDAEHKRVVAEIKKALQMIIEYDGEMPGASEIECGNYRNLSVECAKREAKGYLDKILHVTGDNLAYESGE